VAAASLLAEVRGALNTRLPPPDLTPDQLRSRSWWSGSDLFLIVDDYDLVAGTPVRPAEAGAPGATGAANAGAVSAAVRNRQAPSTPPARRAGPRFTAGTSGIWLYP
jgi:hypothetical protein